MTHPEELLAGYVDGTLSAKDRVAVESHLAECSRCSREVALAGGARTALRSLTEVPAPQGVASKALEEATGARPHRRRDAPLVPVRGHRRGGRRRTVGVHAGPAPHRQRRRLPYRCGAREGPERDRRCTRGSSSGGGKRDRDPTRELRRRLADRVDLVVSERIPGSERGRGRHGAGPRPRSARRPRPTRRSPASSKSAPDQGGELQTLIRARFKGTPAYLAVFTEGPGAGQPADTVTVWVLATTDCRILSFSSAQL